MIVAYINKKVAYPAVQSNIKIVLQNPFIKEGDEKTMEVSFPLRSKHLTVLRDAKGERHFHGFLITLFDERVFPPSHP